MKGCKYARMLAKIQAIAIFHMQDIWGNDLPKFLELCVIKMLRCCVGVHLEAHQRCRRTPTETSVAEFCYECVSLSSQGTNETLKLYFFVIQ